MNKYFKTLASIAVTCIFLVLAWSCSLSNNGTLVGDCKWLPNPIKKDQDIFIKVIDRSTNKPIPNAKVYYTRFEYHNLQTSPGVCNSESSLVSTNDITDGDGIFHVTNSRNYNAETEHTQYNFQVSQNGYTFENFNIFLYLRDNGASKDIYLLPANDRP